MVRSSMALETYRKKRDLKKTPEPPGKKRHTKSHNSFVIQKHAARRLHYDFRLELDGVLLSWAVPKGPSLDPKEKRLAVQVEDHPIDYGKFEGIIPKNQYGAGSVLLWDRGTWTPKGDARKSYAQGRLKFDLHGQKLHGGWTLVRMGKPQEAKENWLLIKGRDEQARSGAEAEIVDRKAESVESGYTVEQISADPKHAWKGGKSRRLKSAVPQGRTAALPQKIKPQLATLVKEVPQGDDWLHEIKYDGYRILCRVSDGKVRLHSRNGLDWSRRFQAIADAAKKLPVKNAWLDGEVVVQKPDGSTSFQALQNALTEGREVDLTYYLFDVPYCNGQDLRASPLIERKRLLAKLVKGNGQIRYSDHVEGKGDAFFSQACSHELEGIISKQRDSKYHAARTGDWVKVKCGGRQEFVIGGYTDPSGSRKGLGALLLGIYEKTGALRYSGKVGTGFTERSLTVLKSRLEKIEQQSSPFSNPPRKSGVHWLQPVLIAEVAFTEWTDDHLIRHASFQGLREDKSAKEIEEEKPAAKTEQKKNPRAGNGKFKLTHPDKVLYQEQGLTKTDLALYYEAVADLILPHVRNRPLTLVRCPNGPKGRCFYQKNINETVPEAIESVPIPDQDGISHYMMANSPPALIGLVQMGVLEIHPWGSTADDLDRPDRMFFDLDPDVGLGFEKVIEAARLLHARLADLGLISFVKTTGGKGLHVVVPLARRHRWDEMKGVSKALAEDIVRQAPRSYTSKMPKAQRKGKIFIDYLRNSKGQTVVAAFSTRAKPGATVSVPLDWKELKTGLRPDQWNVLNLGERLQRLRRDPWQDFFDVRQTIAGRMKQTLGFNR